MVSPWTSIEHFDGARRTVVPLAVAVADDGVAAAVAIAADRGGGRGAIALAPLLEAWAADERGRQRGRVRRLVRLLKQGVPLPEAVEQVPGGVTR